MKIRPGVELASLTDVGCIRANNEDSYSYWEPDDDTSFTRVGRLAVIADGMGGHEGGQIASRMAVEGVAEGYASSTQSDPQKRLLHAFAHAHHQIRHRGEISAALNGMGTTCTAFALIDKLVYFAHVGDSRLYLLESRKLHQLSHDHTLVARWIESGTLRPEEADSHPQKHVLTAALGVTEDIQPDFPTLPIPVNGGNVLLLCTDGLWGQVKDVELQQILTAHSPARACRELVELANHRGGPDNITLQILRVI
ncbi:MAG TPA: Stp1/IreP family PP2C-type Ser/Thr phosphatase [Terriglobales bacterium]|nr:Stp1/IreP family PP2C-type Ser/Thr phosphatase [Terriglobales bacterium]